MQRMLRPREAAKLLGVSTQTLRNWREARKGPPVIEVSPVGQHRPTWRYPLDELLAYVKGGQL
jgi:predicted site-specific integrase-resolvase